MNKLGKFITLAALCAAWMSVVVSAHAQKAASTAGDEFFVVSSVDRAHNALILLRPTEIATAFQTTDKTQFVDENGKPLKLSDFRAGDTIFASYLSKPDGTFTLERVRKGIMTVAELRRRYRDLAGLPSDAGQTSHTTSTPAKPKSTTTKPSTAKPNTTVPNNPESNQSSD